jgi:hypothetical protein
VPVRNGHIRRYGHGHDLVKPLGLHCDTTLAGNLLTSVGGVLESPRAPRPGLHSPYSVSAGGRPTTTCELPAHSTDNDTALEVAE